MAMIPTSIAISPTQYTAVLGPTLILGGSYIVSSDISYYLISKTQPAAFTTGTIVGKATTLPIQFLAPGYYVWVKSDSLTTFATALSNSIVPSVQLPTKMYGTTAFNTAFGSGGTANTNWRTAYRANRAFNAIEVFYANASGSSITFDAAAVAPTSSFASQQNNPVGGGTWAVAASSVTVAAGALQTPSIASTGKISCNSLPPTDGSNFPAFITSTYTLSNINGYSSMTPNFVAGWNVQNPNNPIYSFSQGGGDFTSTSQSSFTSTTLNTIVVPAAVRVYYDRPGICVLNPGDSIDGGDLPVGTEVTIPWRQSMNYRGANILRDAGIPIDFVNNGEGGASAAQINTRGKTFITALNPDLVIIPVWTPNSLFNTQAHWDAQWELFMDLADFAIQSGAQVMLRTPTPWNAMTVGQNNLRLAQRDKAFSTGFVVLDLEPLISNGASPAQYLPGMSLDGIHPSSVADILIAPYSAAAQKQALGL